MNELKAYVWYHEYDTNFERPVVVVQGDRWVRGFDVDPSTGETEPTHICMGYGDDCDCDLSPLKQTSKKQLDLF